MPTPIEDRRYVLRFVWGTYADGTKVWRYYCKGKATTDKLCHAQLFTLNQAKNQKQYAHLCVYAQGSSAATHCEVKRITDKALFIAKLEGK